MPQTAGVGCPSQPEGILFFGPLTRLAAAAFCCRKYLVMFHPVPMSTGESKNARSGGWEGYGDEVPLPVPLARACDGWLTCNPSIEAELKVDLHLPEMCAVSP
ncbi:hypothetical protein OGATHE_000997 [Ogataea polymorpha]|uniref:Uncharacterized protein n=1 Tax=Ogataea polymorpha TaxID=460523 RepID=A0A9P8PSH5_9ASCO|nr:hypothetical protein OGATHE_000997 [Ogataea polymorpha]